MHRKYIFVFTILFLAACERPPIEYSVPLESLVNSKTEGQLKSIGSIKIPTDSITSPRNYYGQATDSYYIIYNESSHALQFYELDSGYLSIRVTLQKEGPNAIPKGSFFYYHNEDSIFFIHHQSRKSYLTNIHGGNTQSFKLNYYGKGEISTNEMFLKFEYNPISKSLYHWLYPNPPAFGWTKDFCYEAKIGEFNLEKDTTSYFGVFPANFYEDDKIYFPNEYFNGHCLRNKYLTYYYPSHEIQLYDLVSKKLIRRINAKSEYIIGDIPAYMENGEETPDLEVETRYLIENPFYVKLISTKSGNFHFRIVKHAVDYYYPDGRKRHYQDVPFSVMVLDSEFKLICERKFEAGKYDFFQSFTHEGHLYLSTNNLLNDNTSDEYFRFEVFKVQ